MIEWDRGHMGPLSGAGWLHAGLFTLSFAPLPFSARLIWTAITPLICFGCVLSLLEFFFFVKKKILTLAVESCICSTYIRVFSWLLFGFFFVWPPPGPDNFQSIFPLILLFSFLHSRKWFRPFKQFLWISIIFFLWLEACYEWVSCWQINLMY